MTRKRPKLTRALSVVGLSVAALSLLTAAVATAQTAASKIPQVGFCGGFGDPGHIFTKTFYEGMRKRGWEDGRNVRIVVQPSGQLPSKPCAQYMADKELDVLVQQQHSDPHPKVPVVTKLANVAGSALAKSSTRNITGITREPGKWEEDSKRIALLKEAFGTTRVLLLEPAVPGPKVKPGIGAPEDVGAELREAAKKMGVDILPVTITKREDLLDPALNAMAREPRTAAIVYDSFDWFKVGAGKELTMFMVRHSRKLPVMATKPEWALVRYPNPELTRIIAYGNSYLDEYDRYAYFVDRLLRGAKPAELPFEQTPNRLAVNVEAAKFSGITFPKSILLQADWVVPPHPQFEWTTTPQPVDPSGESRSPPS